MHNKPEIVFTFPASMGGVASFNYNIINNSLLIKQFYSKVVLIKADEDTSPLFKEKFNVDEVVLFNYSFKENRFYVKKRLSQLLGKAKGAIVTDNSLTLSTAGLFNNPKTVFHLIHDYFYVKENVQMGSLVDVAIAHSSFFSDAVFASNPSYYANRVFYIPYGVKQLEHIPIKKNHKLNLVFLGRLHESKGVMKLYEIEKKLIERNIEVAWAIIGKGPLKEKLHHQWHNATNVSFYEPDSTQEVYNLLQTQDIFIFPTMFEGTPVAILECLANGVVTIANDLPGGIRDMVTPETGFRCKVNDMDEFAKNIATLNNNRDMVNRLQQNCYHLSIDKYDIKNNADDYFKLFLQYGHFKQSNAKKKMKMSFLDKAVFPNALVKTFRGLKK